MKAIEVRFRTALQRQMGILASKSLEGGISSAHGDA